MLFTISWIHVDDPIASKHNLYRAVLTPPRYQVKTLLYTTILMYRVCTVLGF